MPENNLRIISASAGTGKTYRLALEYLAIILQYYGKQDFSLDNILALTFTRKATAEIRERIVAQLNLLTGSNAETEKDKTNLIIDLRRLVAGEATQLSLTEQNLLLSAKHEIQCDASKLQVMTIDAYISHIFRNIVRPLRNIETYEIDIEAIRKRMPFLLNHLMKPDFRFRLNRILSRKVNRSLDTYTNFFTSLIEQRWLYYMISKRLTGMPLSGKERLSDFGAKPEDTSNLLAFQDALHEIIETVNGICLTQGKAPLTDYFNKPFRDLVGSDYASVAAIMKSISNLISEKAERLLPILAKNIWNQQKISAKKYPNDSDALFIYLAKARLKLADHLMQTLYLPEQQEIMELWKIILDEYDRLIYKYKNLTYDDISWFSFEALFSSDPPFLEPESEISASEFYQFLSHRTRFLLIDEFQDTSLIQFNILKPIIAEITSGEGTKPFGGLIVVGDEKQSIFGWRGGQRDLLLNLQTIFPALSEVQTERLNQCWRCGPTLMHFINAVFRHESIHSYLLDKEMFWEYNLIGSAQPKQEAGAKIEFCLRNYSKAGAEQGSSREMFTDFVTRMVVPALDEDPTGSIAILCRKGSELAGVQQALDESGISSLYQPDRSLAEHNYIKPLIYWLRFVAWGDYTDFVAFLRSDYLRINTPLLKQTLNQIAAYYKANKPNSQLVTADFSALPLIQQLQNLATLQREQSPTFICRKLMDNCLSGKNLSERDHLNLHAWLNKLTAWEISEAGKGNTLPDLLAWVTENYSTEDFKQVSISGEDSLQLLTIHKCKGLQFKRVFLFYNLSSGHRDDNTRLQWALQYAGRDFHLVNDFGISYHYDKVLQASSYGALWQAEQNRELLEEMNNLYVAFTRAEQKLHLYFCYNNKASWEDYYTERANASLPLQLCNAVKAFFGEATPDQRGVYCHDSIFSQSPGEEAEKKTKPETATSPVSPCQQVSIRHHKCIPWSALQAIDQPQVANLKQLWLVDRPNLSGDLLHFYLSFILRNLGSEHIYAHKRCLQRYGAIFQQSQISELGFRCQQACNANPWLFASGWDKIFTEQELVLDGRVLRLDRLMLNTAQKDALIVDYKSGEVHDLLQLDTYAAALINLKSLQGYHIHNRIVHLPE